MEKIPGHFYGFLNGINEKIKRKNQQAQVIPWYGPDPTETPYVGERRPTLLSVQIFSVFKSPFLPCKGRKSCLWLREGGRGKGVREKSGYYVLLPGAIPGKTV